MRVFWRGGWAKHHILKPGADHVWCNSRIKWKEEDEVQRPLLSEDLCTNCTRLSKWHSMDGQEKRVNLMRRNFIHEKERAHLGTTLPKPGMNTP